MISLIFIEVHQLEAATSFFYPFRNNYTTNLQATYPDISDNQPRHFGYYPDICAVEPRHSYLSPCFMRNNKL
jgi:hypothetical protein